MVAQSLQGGGLELLRENQERDVTENTRLVGNLSSDQARPEDTEEHSVPVPSMSSISSQTISSPTVTSREHAPGPVHASPSSTLAAVSKSCNTSAFVQRLRRSGANSEVHGKTMASIDILDFAGQEAFSAIQHLLVLNKRCGSIVAFDVNKPLNVVYQPTFASNGLEYPVANSAGKTPFDVIEDWLIVLFEAGGHQCPIYLVACQIDRVPESHREAKKEQVRKYIRDNLKGKPYEFAADTIFFVDNTKSSNWFFKDQAVEELRDRFLNDMMKTESLASPVPLRWLPFTMALSSLAQQGLAVLSLEDAYALACKAGQCKTEAEAMELLQLHHHLGNLLHFQKNKALRHRVVIDIPWLVSVVAALLVPPTDQSNLPPRIRSHFKYLNRKGILTKHLLHHMWRRHRPEHADKLQEEGLFRFVLDLMEEFALLVDPKLVMGIDGRGEIVYWFPSLVIRRMDLVTVHQSGGDVVYSQPLFLLPEGQLRFPVSIFWRLVVTLLIHFRDTKPATSGHVPDLYQNAVRLLIDHSYFLEVQHCSAGIGLSVQFDSAAVPLGTPAPLPQPMEAVCSSVLLLVESKLASLVADCLQRLTWVKACVCPCPRGRHSACRRHSARDCAKTECQHFIKLVNGELPQCPEHGRYMADVSDILSMWMPDREVIIVFLRSVFLFSATFHAFVHLISIGYKTIIYSNTVLPQ